MLPNHPNPFNPETWIPFQLASRAGVRIEIFDARGRLVRRLSPGHLDAGYYLSRDSAAHWDERNEQGEFVSTGICFYRLSASGFSAVRKMVILK